MKTNDTSTRELALEWWYNLELFDHILFADWYCQRHYKTLTGREIEEIWVKEVFQKLTPSQANFVEKPNRKQFKEFSPELFKAYIDKFSDEDKVKALDILENSIGKEILIERELVKLESNG